MKAVRASPSLAAGGVRERRLPTDGSVPFRTGNYHRESGVPRQHYVTITSCHPPSCRLVTPDPPGMSGNFRLTVFDPFLIFSQIITIQSLWYSSLGVLILLAAKLSGTSGTLSHVFSDDEIRGSLSSLLIVSFLVNALFGSFFLWFVIKRAKPCLDHAVTIHIIHVISCCLFTGHLPTSLSWWLLNVICAGITCITAEFLCLRSEMKDIPLLSKSDV